MIVSSFSIIGDWVNVLIKDIPIFSHITLIPQGADPHLYQLTAKDSCTLAKAYLIVRIGLNFEPGLPSAIHSACHNSIDLPIGDLLKLPFSPTIDPHVWLDIDKAQSMIGHIKQALHKALTNKKLLNYIPKLEKNFNNYVSHLRNIDRRIEQYFAPIRAENRNIMSTHDAFGYFGKRYHLNFFAPLGLSTDEEPSTRKVTALIEQINAGNIRAIFFENFSNRGLIRQISRETKLIVREDRVLYADSTSDAQGPAPDYASLMLHNAELIASTLLENQSCR